MIEPSGEVFDLGYQHYEGPREGRMRARMALWTSGLRTAIGLGRGTRAKILPIFFFLATISPALILTLIVSVSGPQEDLPGHAGYYQLVSIFALLFSAVIAPELLCPDRHEGVLHLYFVRPITATDYVAGRWLAFFSITLAIVYSGQVVLLIGYILAATEPLDYIRDNWLDIPRFLGAGVVVALFTTTIPMAVAAFTTRRAYAAAFVIGIFVVSSATAGILTECSEEEEVFIDQSGTEITIREDVGDCRPLTGDAAKWFALVDAGRVPIHVSDMIFGEENTSGLSKAMEDLNDAVPVGWYVLLTAGSGLVLLWRYRRLHL